MKKISIIETAVPFQGTILLPGDKSISHRALLLAAISQGISTITGLLESADIQSTKTALQQLGVKIESLARISGLEQGKVNVHGVEGRFSPPLNIIDCGNSGTTMRLLTGLLAAQPFSSRLTGDTSLLQRPMERIVAPLRMMGASIYTQRRDRPPIVVGGNTHLCPLSNYVLPIASAQLKSTLLLASLFAKGTTTIIEPTPTRDHTERLFELFNLRLTTHEHGISKIISLSGPQRPQACNLTIPGDISSAAFWIVAATIQPQSLLRLESVGLNPTRTGFLNVLKRMGAAIEIKFSRDQIEPQGNMIVNGSSLMGTRIEGNEIPGVIDELPILAVAGALAKGKTVIRDASELRFKETDRITAIVHNLRAMGVTVIEYPDGLEIQGRSHLQSASLKSFGDHRIAMAFSIAALFAKGISTIDDRSCITTSYPGFETVLQKWYASRG